MAIADDLQAARAGLQMINPTPFNAEAPPEALAGEITPTELHYVRSNFAVPAHDGTLEVGGAVESPTTLTLDDLRAMPPVRAGGDARMRGERAPRHETATHRGTLGRLRSLHRTLDRRAPPRRAGAGAPRKRRRRRPVPGRRPRRVPPEAGTRGDRQGRLDLRTRSAARPRSRSRGRDPDRLRDERRATGSRPRSPLPTHRPSLVRRRVREVAEANRRADRAVQRRVSDRPLHVRVARPTARGRQSHARACADHRSRSGVDHQSRHARCARQGLVGNRTRNAGRRQPHRRRRLAPGAGRAAPGPYHWQEWSFDWAADDVGRHTLRARATDAAGHTQPEVPPWNRLGYGNNAVEVIYIDVG